MGNALLDHCIFWCVAAFILKIGIQLKPYALQHHFGIFNRHGRKVWHLRGVGILTAIDLDIDRCISGHLIPRRGNRLDNLALLQLRVINTDRTAGNIQKAFFNQLLSCVVKIGAADIGNFKISTVADQLNNDLSAFAHLFPFGIGGRLLDNRIRRFG